MEVMRLGPCSYLKRLNDGVGAQKEEVVMALAALVKISEHELISRLLHQVIAYV